MKPLLSPGDCVAIISPSIVLSDKKSLNLDAGITYLQNLGLKVLQTSTACTGLQLTPTSDSQKVADIMEMYQNSKVKALFAAHGGASSLRLLPLLDYKIIQKNPKPIFGFSDSTTLQLGIYAKTKIPFVTGISLEYEFRNRNIDLLVDQDLRSLIEGKSFFAQEGQTLNPGQAEGILLGECLSCISQLNGTPFAPNLSDALLLIEDECEPPYKIDQMLMQLSLQPTFSKVKGIIFGQFSECTSSAHTHGTVEDILKGFAKHHQIPMMSNFRFGHFPARHVLTCGVRYHLDTTNKTLQQLD